MKTAFWAASAFVVLSVAGCATSRDIIGPDGKKVMSISCNGGALDISSCYEKAGEICGSAGYEVLNTDSASSPLMLANGRPGGGFNMTAVTIIKRNIMARCKATE